MSIWMISSLAFRNILLSNFPLFLDFSVWDSILNIINDHYQKPAKYRCQFMRETGTQRQFVCKSHRGVRNFWRTSIRKSLGNFLMDFWWQKKYVSKYLLNFLRDFWQSRICLKIFLTKELQIVWSESYFQWTFHCESIVSRKAIGKGNRICD